jgi:hypothetical protein
LTSKRTGLTQDDIEKARERFAAFLSAAVRHQEKLLESRKDEDEGLVRNDDYIEIRLKDGKLFKGQNVIKLKTVFHSVEVTVKDHHGGILKAHYDIRNTISGLYDWILDKYPPTSVADIQKFAREKNISYDDAKKEIALVIAEAEYWIRIAMARFLHEELAPTLKLILNDLIDDASLFGLSRYGCKLEDARDIDKSCAKYVKLRKNRSNIVRHRGERGRSFLSDEDAYNYVVKVVATMEELEKSGKKITANAVARKMIDNKHTNPLKAFKDMLNKCGVTFDFLLKGHMRKSKS